MGGFSNKMQLPQNFCYVILVWGAFFLFFFFFIISIFIFYFFLIEAYAGNYICWFNKMYNLFLF